jgi:hypothetical protein
VRVAASALTTRRWEGAGLMPAAQTDASLSHKATTRTTPSPTTSRAPAVALSNRYGKRYPKRGPLVYIYIRQHT